MKFPTLQPFHLEGMTIRILASSPAVQPLKQSVPGLSQSGSCSLSSTQMNGRNAAASTPLPSISNSLEGYMHGQPLPPLGLGSSGLQSKAHQYQYYPRVLSNPLPRPGKSILSTSQSKFARRPIASRGVHFADTSGIKPLTETKEISRWISRADFERWAALCAHAIKETNQELAEFPPNCSRDWHKHWCASPIATTIVRGEHKGRLGYILKHYKCNKYLKVCLVSRESDFPRSQPVVVKRRHIQQGAQGSLTSSHQPQDQRVDGDADDFSMCNWMAEDDDYQWEDDEGEDGDDQAPSPSTSITTTIGKKHPCPSSLQGRPAKRQKVEHQDEKDIAPTPSPFTTITTTIGKKHPCPSSLKGRPAKCQRVEQSTTIIGGKYAGQKCIILKHLARRVRVQLLDSGRVTCISRGSLGLDEVKTIWHAQPRRSPRIQAMKIMEGSTCRKSQSLAAGNP